jgi:hypothetical protein
MGSEPARNRYGSAEPGWLAYRAGALRHQWAAPGGLGFQTVPASTVALATLAFHHDLAGCSSRCLRWGFTVALCRCLRRGCNLLDPVRVQATVQEVLCQRGVHGDLGVGLQLGLRQRIAVADEQRVVDVDG